MCCHNSYTSVLSDSLLDNCGCTSSSPPSKWTTYSLAAPSHVVISIKAELKATLRVDAMVVDPSNLHVPPTCVNGHARKFTSSVSTAWMPIMTCMSLLPLPLSFHTWSLFSFLLRHACLYNSHERDCGQDLRPRSLEGQNNLHDGHTPLPWVKWRQVLFLLSMDAYRLTKKMAFIANCTMSPSALVTSSFPIPPLIGPILFTL